MSIKCSALRRLIVYVIASMISILIGIINTKPASAQEFSGPIASSTGGAGRGSALGPDAHFLNPAGLSFLKGLLANYYYRYEEFPEHDRTKDWAVQLTDAHEGALVPAAFSYLATDRLESGARIEETSYQLSLAFRIIERLSLGLVGQRWEQIRPNIPVEEIWQMGFGVLGYPMDGFSVGFTAKNVLDEHTRYVRPEVGLGTEIFYQDLFRFRLDGIYPTKFNPNRKGIIGTGFEMLFESGMRMRLGSRWDDVENSAKGTVGLGWEGPNLSFQYSIERDYRVERLRQSFDLRSAF